MKRIVTFNNSVGIYRNIHSPFSTFGVSVASCLPPPSCALRFKLWSLGAASFSARIGFAAAIVNFRPSSAIVGDFCGESGLLHWSFEMVLLFSSCCNVSRSIKNLKSECRIRQCNAKYLARHLYTTRLYNYEILNSAYYHITIFEINCYTKWIKIKL